MGTEGEYESYADGYEIDPFKTFQKVYDEVEEMKNDAETFKDFNIGICAITEDGAKFLKGSDVKEFLG